MKKKLSKDEAKSLLKPYLKDLEESFTDSWKSYRGQEYSGVRHLHSPRTRANILYDHIVDNVRKRLDGEPGINFLVRQGLLLLEVKSKILMKFKKLDKKKMSRTYPTKQARAIAHQLSLPGLSPQAHYLVAGYQLDKLQTSMNGVFVTFPIGKKLEWDLPLLAEPESKPVPEITHQGTQEEPLQVKAGDLLDKNKGEK